MDVAILSGYTLLAWLVHLGLASLYIRKLDTKSLKFRLIHSAEIGLLVVIMMAIFDRPLATLAIIWTILATLAILDLTLFLVRKSLIQKFDVLHFVVAYGMVTVVVLLFN